MDNKIWVFANLTDQQLEMLKEAERTLGSLNILALQPVESKVANLTESQIECLQGLEHNLGLTLVAYQKV